jgi:HAD superfamily hydrolase (TIGR01509 family)
MGKAVKDERARIEAHTGKPLTEAWMASFRERRNQQLMARVQPIRHVADAVGAVHAAYGGRIACASGADMGKVKLQLQKTGLLRWFEGRVFSGHDLPRSKPHPDVYLAAAAALSVDPRRCAVVEDTVTGVTAGVAAGATVFGYSPPEMGHDTPVALRAAGAVAVFTDMADLPHLLATWA